MQNCISPRYAIVELPYEGTMPTLHKYIQIRQINHQTNVLDVH